MAQITKEMDLFPIIPKIVAVRALMFIGICFLGS